MRRCRTIRQYWARSYFAERRRRELIAAKLAHRLGVEPREIGEHTVEVCTGFDFNQRFQDRSRAKPVKMFGSTLGDFPMAKKLKR